MTVRKRSRIWTQQPQVWNEVDENYRDGLILCLHAPALRDISGVKNDLTYTLSANLERVVGFGGRGVLHQNSSPTIYYANAGRLISNAKYLTISCVFQKHLSDKKFLVFAGWGAHYQALCEVTADGSILWGVYQDSGNILLKITAAGVIQTGRVHSIVASFEAGVISCFVDGVNIPLATDGWVAGSPTQVADNQTQHLTIGSRDDGAWFAGTIYHLAAWTRPGLQKQKLSENPWQIFAPRSSRRLISAGGGSVNANASGALSVLSVAAPTASASGSAFATGALAAITIYAPTATASAGGSAAASGSFAALSITPATATATATTSATASGAFAAISLSATSATATATTSATASGAFAAISLSAPNATATGTTAGNAIATATSAQITINPATASAIGLAVASGAFAALSITPPTATATSAGDAHAIAAFAALSINPTTGAAYGSAIATGSLPVILLSPATGAASTGTFTGSISDADITRIVQAVLAALNSESIAAAVWAHATRVITGPTPNDNADALLARNWP